MNLKKEILREYPMKLDNNRNNQIKEKERKYKTKVEAIDKEKVIKIAQQKLKYADREKMLAIFKKEKGYILNVVSVGDLNSSLVHPREVLKPILIENVEKFFIAHNHPSGNIKATQADIDSTRRLIKAANLVGVKLVDHLVVGSGEGYFSLKEKELI